MSSTTAMLTTFCCNAIMTSIYIIQVCTHPTRTRGPCKFCHALSHGSSVWFGRWGSWHMWRVIDLRAHDQYQSKAPELMFTSIAAHGHKLCRPCSLAQCECTNEHHETCL